MAVVEEERLFIAGRVIAGQVQAAALDVAVIAFTGGSDQSGRSGAVVARGELRGDTRRILLALDRLSHVQVDAGARTCTYPSDFRPGEFFQSAFGIHRGEESHQVRLRIDAAHSSAVRERTWHATQQLEESPDGSVVLTMQLGSLDEVTDGVLGMGEHVCVEGPRALIERVRARLERALARFKPAP